MLELAHAGAQELFKKISSNIAKAEPAVWSETKRIESDIQALGARLKDLAYVQTDEAKACIREAFGKLDAARAVVKD